MHGVSQSATDLASWLKDVNNAFNPIMQLCSAFEIALQKNDSSSFIDQLSEDQRRRNVQALGFDPNNISLDQLKEAVDILTTIYQDPALQEAIKQFCIDYVKAQHSVSYFHVGGSAIFEIILSAVLITLTAGAGLGVRAASMGNKTRLFKELGELLVDFAKRNQKHKKPHAEQKATYSYEQAVFEPYSPESVNFRSSIFYQHYGNNPNRGLMSNVEARKWYLKKEATIPNLLNPNEPLEQQARKAFELRNEFRKEARERMNDRITSDRLTREEANFTWGQMHEKTRSKLIRNGTNNPSDNEIYNEIISSSQRSRTSVNAALGLEK